MSGAERPGGADMNGLQQFWQQTDSVGRAVALLLLAMSISAWVVILWKAWVLRSARRSIARLASSHAASVSSPRSIDASSRGREASCTNPSLQRSIVGAGAADGQAEARSCRPMGMCNG